MVVASVIDQQPILRFVRALEPVERARVVTEIRIPSGDRARTTTACTASRDQCGNAFSRLRRPSSLREIAGIVDRRVAAPKGSISTEQCEPSVLLTSREQYLRDRQAVGVAHRE